jgi:hypothetical protein
MTWEIFNPERFRGKGEKAENFETADYADGADS